MSVTLDASRDRGRRSRHLASDAHVVALMRENGVRSIWTHDRDYRRCPGVEVLDPFGDGPSPA